MSRQARRPVCRSLNVKKARRDQKAPKLTGQTRLAEEACTINRRQCRLRASALWIWKAVDLQASTSRRPASSNHATAAFALSSVHPIAAHSASVIALAPTAKQPKYIEAHPIILGVDPCVQRSLQWRRNSRAGSLSVAAKVVPGVSGLNSSRDGSRRLKYVEMQACACGPVGQYSSPGTRLVENRIGGPFGAAAAYAESHVST